MRAPTVFRPAPRRSSAALALALALAAAGACGGDKAVAPLDPALVGHYVLVSVNGAPLPWVWLQRAVGHVDVTQGEIDLFANRTYARNDTYMEYGGPGDAGTPWTGTAQSGAFAVSGSTLTLKEDYGPGLGVLDVATMTVSAGRLTTEDPLASALFTYEKR